ncbi:ABC transporter ATP-binding protein [Flavobacterium psychrophilum]|uniref:ABC transporter ATP-binding protein n=1 Tax=Flavobacterium psychrophilum TaxID=96345 RepID=A0A7U2RAM4_FLAPS|nr:ABC transporter ATP-binding protein [Flavobacterium psychrophilum]AIN73655.1 ABC transporter ATP-binding protein [Flavobacterium psychrophilum FPG3]EKT2069824.1 ABC transporter ATP-binding protein [Flavobacterium psychrophilum]EKT2072084.1 ABC transporter ATP-binding protein [Flavobacterium psychrophilum]EKT3963634.1 ABC transporter ATP-binding protein [Flavobacterium psychrophilum]EKT4491606.1 ABC transporter ATP-binding protein [Flavobacterium psychrophilum]
MLQVKNISFGYTDKIIINNINFTVTQGQNIAILGESGCGKSTLLKLLYGLYDLGEGQIFWKEKEVLGPKYNLIPGMPFMKYMAQDFDLSPYETVSENIGKFLSNAFNALKKLRVEELLEIVEMTEFAKVKVNLLSGGQQQRVALARVLALEPEILLLDEPFSHIDNFRKNALRRNLFSYLKSRGITCFIATHDSTDALSFSDQTIVLKDGKIIDKAPSADVYTYPMNKYVASLFGEVNELKLSQLIEIDGEDEDVLLYPHQLKISEKGTLTAIVKQTYFKGSHYLIKAVLNRKVIFFEHDSSLNTNDEVKLTIM